MAKAVANAVNGWQSPLSQFILLEESRNQLPHFRFSNISAAALPFCLLFFARLAFEIL